MWLVATLTFTTAGCSVFISTPEVARYQIQQLDNSFVEVVVHLDPPAETDLDIHLNNQYTLQLEFEWLWSADETAQVYGETEVLLEEAQLIPWMMCKYRF